MLLWGVRWCVSSERHYPSQIWIENNSSNAWDRWKKSSLKALDSGNAESLGPLSWERHSSCESSTTHSCQCVLSFHTSRQCYGCQCLGFLTCIQILMHAVAQAGSTDIIRECTQNWPGKKSLAVPGTRTHVSIAPGFSVRHSTSWAIPAVENNCMWGVQKRGMQCRCISSSTTATVPVVMQNCF